MKIELTDGECCLAARALEDFARRLRDDAALPYTMPDEARAGYSRVATAAENLAARFNGVDGVAP